jgi:hypothetical protein
VSDAFHDKNTIAKSLTDEELFEFLEKLSTLPQGKRTLEAIKAMAGERGISISIESARTFRNTTFQKHLERMRRRREKAEHIVSLAGDGTGRALGDAAASMLAEQIFDELNTVADETGDDENPTPLDLERAEAMSRMIARLRSGDVQREALEARLRESDAKLREYEAKEKDREEKAKVASEAMKKLREPGAAISDSERAAIVATVDEVLGIKVTKKG